MSEAVVPSEEDKGRLQQWGWLLAEIGMLPLEEQDDLLTEFHGMVVERAGVLRSRIELLDRIREGLGREIDAAVLPPDGTAVSLVAVELTERLRAHHAVLDHPMDRREFEAACVMAALSAGLSAEVPASRTHAKWDVRIVGTPVEHWALKTEGSAAIGGDKVTVSKLTEARWIQLADNDPAVLADGIREYARNYVADVQRLLTLRHLQSQTGVHVYQFVEIPVGLLVPLTEMDVAVLEQTLTTAATVRVPIDVADDERVDVPSLFDGLAGGRSKVSRTFSVRLDKSDGKVSLAGIPLSACVVRGVWTLPPLTRLTDGVPTG